LIEIITGVERRRRWSAAEKLRIVAETEQPGAGIAEIARRYEISRGLLWNWRSLVRRGVLRAEPQAVFVPIQVIREPSIAEQTKHTASPVAAGSDAAVADSKIEITLPDGTSIRVGHDISLVTLRRVMTVLRG
jgi:transposase